MHLKKENIPLYFQLEQILRSKIIIGEFTPGDQIPTERELSNIYGVSSITTRQAILNLVSEGLLIRKPGKGTFVTEEITNTKTLQLSGNINDLITDALKTREVRVLDITRIKPPKRVANLLNTEEDEEVVQVRRTRSANDVPISYVKNYLPLEIGKNIRKEDLSVYPMLQILRDQLEIPVRSGIQYIEAIVADDDISSALSVSISSPILYIETVIFARQKRPVEFVQTYVRPDRYRYSVKLSVKEGPGNEVRVLRKE